MITGKMQVHEEGHSYSNFHGGTWYYPKDSVGSLSIKEILEMITNKRLTAQNNGFNPNKEVRLRVNKAKIGRITGYAHTYADGYNEHLDEITPIRVFWFDSRSEMHYSEDELELV